MNKMLIKFKYEKYKKVQARKFQDCAYQKKKKRKELHMFER